MNNFTTRDVVGAAQDLMMSTEHKPDIVTLQGKIISGLGVATRTIARQLSLISEGFPEISGCWPGTINLELEVPLIVINPTHRTPPLAWTPSGVTREIFDLVRIELELSNMVDRVPAWLYIAHGSPHRETPSIHEIITQRLDISASTCCQIYIPADTVIIGAECKEYSLTTLGTY